MKGSMSRNLTFTAAMVAIGDELLSGRTRDANLHYLAGWLTARGIALREVRVVPDEEAAIVRAVNELRGQVALVFTSGGIGPTHDDITADAIGTAFGLPVVEDPGAMEVLRQWYEDRGEEVTPVRARMARMPEGAALIRNSVSGAPGFRVENVHVMAGVPQVFCSMLDHLDTEIERGPVPVAQTVTGGVRESLIADPLRVLLRAHPLVTAGSYPRLTESGPSVAIVLRGQDAGAVASAADAAEDIFRRLNISPERFKGEVKAG